MKKKTHAPAAQRMYIQQMMTFEEIAELLGVSERTVRLWADAGNWRERRKDFLDKSTTLHEEIYDTARALMKSVREDIVAGNPLDSGRLYSMTKLVDKLTKVKEYENEVAAADQQGQQAGLTQEVLDKIDSDVFGL